MEHDAVFSRTQAVTIAQAIWRVSDIASFDPVLKFELRTKALQVVTLLAAQSCSFERGEQALAKVRGCIAGVQGLLELGQGLGLISSENALRITTAYERVVLKLTSPLEEEFLGEEREDAISDQVDSSIPVLSARQERILAFLNTCESGEVRMNTLKALFGEEVSEKTLQRDLLGLVSNGHLRRQGDTRWTTYISASRQAIISK